MALLIICGLGYYAYAKFYFPRIMQRAAQQGTLPALKTIPVPATLTPAPESTSTGLRVDFLPEQP